MPRATNENRAGKLTPERSLSGWLRFVELQEQCTATRLNCIETELLLGVTFGERAATDMEGGGRRAWQLATEAQRVYEKASRQLQEFPSETDLQDAQKAVKRLEGA